MSRWLIWLVRLKDFAYDFMMGSAHSWLSTMQTLRRRNVLERIFILTMIGEFAGMPFLPAPYMLRLLPYVTPQILTWRRAKYMWSDELEAAARHLHH